jgi:hypothetical protein
MKNGEMYRYGESRTSQAARRCRNVGRTGTAAGVGVEGIDGGDTRGVSVPPPWTFVSLLIREG